ncbi:hypothetical protein XENORESO_000288 [Xenotaenia resolanae]|uniref:Uncharacterized protein n=1 Tax=Xenotaenia resolanae TaxID=208358 RepID=A0ABV0WCK7_9TELE
MENGAKNNAAVKDSKQTKKSLVCHKNWTISVQVGLFTTFSACYIFCNIFCNVHVKFVKVLFFHYPSTDVSLTRGADRAFLSGRTDSIAQKRLDQFTFFIKSMQNASIKKL